MKRGHPVTSLFTALALSALGALGTACHVTAVTPAPAQPDAGDDAGAEADDAAAPKSCVAADPRPDAPEVFIGPTGLEARLVALIDGATTSLSVLMYEIDSAKIIDAFVAAKKRGVDVRMVIDHDESAPAKATLRAGGVGVHESSTDFAYAHAKAMVIDGARAVIMSANMNGYSLEGERNYGMISAYPGDVADVQAVFDADWSGAPGTVALPCTKLLVSPINARAGLVDVFRSATTKLDLAVMYVTDGTLVAALEERAKAGVAVRVLLADPAWISDNTASAQSLAAAGIPVKFYKALDLHAKLVISDDRVFIGSENLSANSLDNNREVGAIVTNASSVAPIAAQFETDWAAGVAP